MKNDDSMILESVEQPRRRTLGLTGGERQAILRMLMAGGIVFGGDKVLAQVDNCWSCNYLCLQKCGIGSQCVACDNIRYTCNNCPGGGS